MKIRPVQPSDRDRILEILRATGRFSDEEVGWAMELVDHALAHEDSEYGVWVGEDDCPGGGTAIVGYVCVAPTPRTDGVFDLYWIAVEPARQQKGAGRALLEFVESVVRARDGRMLLIETSSKESYAPTRRFYRGNGYVEVSRIKDFYRIRDDKIVLSKVLEGEEPHD